MRTSATFTPSDSDQHRLFDEYPFAQLVSKSDDGLLATPLPLLVLREPDSSLTVLGHLAKANPHAAALAKDPQALVIFTGPHGYLSPSWLSDRTQAPTWNYATAHLKVCVELLPGIPAAKAAVEMLTAAMEKGRPNAWSPNDMAERYDRLLPHVVAFRASVLSINAKFKLGQNERPDVLEESLTGIAATSAQDLYRYMAHANRHRLPISTDRNETAEIGR